MYGAKRTPSRREGVIIVPDEKTQRLIVGNVMCAKKQLGGGRRRGGRGWLRQRAERLFVAWEAATAAAAYNVDVFLGCKPSMTPEGEGEGEDGRSSFVCMRRETVVFCVL